MKRFWKSNTKYRYVYLRPNHFAGFFSSAIYCYDTHDASGYAHVSRISPKHSFCEHDPTKRKRPKASIIIIRNESHSVAFGRRQREAKRLLRDVWGLATIPYHTVFVANCYIHTSVDFIINSCERIILTLTVFKICPRIPTQRPPFCHETPRRRHPGPVQLHRLLLLVLLLHRRLLPFFKMPPVILSFHACTRCDNRRVQQEKNQKTNRPPGCHCRRRRPCRALRRRRRRRHRQTQTQIQLPVGRQRCKPGNGRVSKPCRWHNPICPRGCKWHNQQ